MLISLNNRQLKRARQNTALCGKIVSIRPREIVIAQAHLPASFSRRMTVSRRISTVD
jgi:hypothetical protein